MTSIDTILIVDDDSELRLLISRVLEKHGFRTFTAENSGQALTILGQQPIDLILLDILLDNENGLTFCKTIREKSSIPLVLLTAMDDIADKVLGLEMGADDYICKPFHPREVIARIRTILRRSKNPVMTHDVNETLYFSGWKLLPQQKRLFSPANVEVSLSAGEYILLDIFLRHPNRVLSREQLLQEMQKDHAAEVFDRSVDVQVSRLRKRIDCTLIKTMRGDGYLFSSSVEKR